MRRCKLVLIGLTFGLGLGLASASAPVTIRLASESEFAAGSAEAHQVLDPPAHGSISIQRNQSFVVGPAGQRPFTVVPVRYDPGPVAPSGAVNATFCAVVISPADGTPAYAVTTIGAGVTEPLSCSGLQALGLLPSSDVMPRLGMLYSASSPNREVTAPVVLIWDSKAQRYRPDAAEELFLSDRLTEGTLAAMRKALESYRPNVSH